MPFLDWVNKNQATQASQQVPYRLLRAVSAHGDVDVAMWSARQEAPVFTRATGQRLAVARA